MQELLIVNPSRRPSKRRKTRKAASPAQKRARAAFAAAARARAGKRRTKRKASPTLSIMSNPRKRRTHRRHTHHARRRNPLHLGGGSLKPMSILTPALIGALGAVTVNTVLGKLPLPAAAMTGKVRYVTQAAAAIGLAMLAKKLGVKGATAVQAAEGSLTVTLHQAIVDVAGGMGMNLSGMGYYLPGVGVRNAIPYQGANPAPMAMNGMGKYITGPGAPRANVVPMSRAPMAMKGISRGKGGFGF